MNKKDLSANYATKIREEGDFWDNEFLDTNPDTFKCCLQKCLFFRQNYTQRFVDEIIRLCPPGSTVLDLGCGKGWLTMGLAKQGAHVTGVDVARKCLDRAKDIASEQGISSCTFEYFDANVDSLPPNHYDVIVSWGTLHHVQNIEHNVAQIKYALRPNGHFVLLEAVDRKGTRARFADILADIFHFLLPTDRSYIEKVRYVFHKKVKGEHELQWSPFEMAGGANWLYFVKSNFGIISEKHFLGFLSPFIARLRGPKVFTSTTVRSLHLLDWILLKTHILTPEYYFIVAEKE